MLVTNFKVFITKHGDGAITFTKKNISFKVYISKKDEVIFRIFNQHYKRLKSFKNRHYAIAEDIARDIRAKGYVFKAYSNNFRNIRPLLLNKASSLISKDSLRRK